ncbi:MAG: uracil-DNA glycosylase [Acidimicrobiia bacterium]|nr:uracil-DNA glycosylase [Acidimicrobiia bacterium]
MTSEDRATRLRLLQTEASTCTRCPLHEGRTTVVFGEGNPDADLMIIGEGPGQREDEQGRPFVGRSGQLLSTLLERVGLDRSEVYISNVVKCRPPGNRDPRPAEIDACKGYLVEQLKLIDPAAVVTLGNFSTKLLLKTEVGITRMRGQAYPWWGRHVVPTFHPAAALRSGARVVEEMVSDLQLAVQVIEQPASPAPVEVAEVREPEQIELFT